MNQTTQSATRWIYEGVWSVLVEWFRVPKEPPSLPGPSDETFEAFKPAPGFLRYMKLWFWLGLLPLDIAILIGWLAIVVADAWVGVLLAPVAFFLAVAPDVVVYVGLHLRYDTTWYVMTNRTLRIRRGVWVIHEVTITFENVQNVKVRQGPVQRYFSIADVVIETAGAGGEARQKGFQVTNQGVIEGIGDPDRIRRTITERLRESRSAGLGDEGVEQIAGSAVWSSEHVAALREIRDEIAALAGA